MSWVGAAPATRPHGQRPPNWRPMAGQAAPAGQGYAAMQRMPQQPPGAQQQMGIKRPAPAQGGPIADVAMKSPKTMGESSIVVFSTAEQDEIGIRTLVGEYLEEGTNHGRKYYRKHQKIPGHENIDVFLYFWDKRDGDNFSGWWFGNQVGGAQVWSRNKECTPTPPRSGWTIPWDGDIKKELSVMSSVQKAAYDKEQAQARMQSRKAEEEEKMGDAQAADWEDRVQRATAKAATAEIDVGEALEAATQALEGQIDDDVVAAAQEQLLAQAQTLAETQRFLAVEALAAQKAPPALKAEMAALGHRVRKLQARVKDEQQRLKNAKLIKAKQAEDEEARIQEEVRERELEGTHSKQLEEMLPAVMEKVDVAEDEVEKVAIAAAPLQIDTADDLRPVMLQAIKETEQRFRTAQAAVGEAKRFITGKVQQVQRFVSSTRKQALDEFTTMQDKLNEATKKLEPFKNVRADYEQRVQGRKLYEELSGKLAGAEIEVEKAAMMTAPLGGDSAEGIKETETALSAAQSVVSQTSRLIDSKLKAHEKNKGPVYDDVKALQERAKQAQEKLDEVRKTVKETQIRIAADNLLRDVSERVSNAEDELQRMAEAELPFLRGDQKGPDMDAMIAEADKVAVKVHTALAEAQTFVAKKLIEVARFTEGPAKAVREEVDMLQKRLEEGRERLQQFKAGTADRKRAHLLQEVETKVAGGEIEVQRLTEAVNALTNMGSAGEVVTEGLQETVEQANLAERSAQASVVVARKYLLQKTTELKKLIVSGSGAGSGTELGKLQTRVNNMQQEIAKLRGLTKEAEERIRVKQLLSEVVMRLQAGEAEVDKVASAAVPLREEQPSAEAVERMEKSTTSAQTKLTATAKLIDVKLKSASGFLKEELTGMRARITSAERKLAEVIRASREQKERLLASDLIAQAVEKVEHAEAEVQKSAESELPFLKGIEVLVAQDAQSAITACEQAAAKAQSGITDARTFVVQKLVEAKQFSEGPADTCGKELMSLQKKLDLCASKLAEMKRDTAERKRKVQMQASIEKISTVEGTVQKLADVMTKFTEDKLITISPEDARGVCEEIALTEHSAQAAVSDARKFLAMRVQEAKSFNEAQRAGVNQDLAKLQSKLTQCQVELAKLSKQCTEREQKFVAHRLLQEATQSLEKLQKDVEYAGKIAAPLLADDKSELSNAVHVQSMLDAVQAYMKKSGLTIEAVFKSITQKKNATSDELTSFLQNLADLTGNEDACFTPEHSAAIFSMISSGGKLTGDSLKSQLPTRYVCTATVKVTDAPEGGKDLGAIEVGEGIDLLEEKEANGMACMKCIRSRDRETVWVTLANGETGSYFRLAPPMAGQMASIEAYIAAVHAKCVEAAEHADRKTVEVASVKQGPLAEVKAKLLQVRTKMSQEQSKVEQLKKRAAAARLSVESQRKQDVQKVQETKCKAFAEKSVAEAKDVVESAVARANKAIESVKGGSAEKLNGASVADLQALKKSADDALKALADAKAAVAKSSEKHEAYKGSCRNLLLEARVELTKLSSSAAAAEKRCNAATEVVRAAYTQAVKKATQEARKALQNAARQADTGIDDLFDKVAAGKPLISQAQFSKFIKSLPSAKLTEDQVKLVFQEFGADGLKKSGFAKALQEFCTCTKPTTVTKQSATDSTVVRKLEAGELFELLEGPVEDNKVPRVRGRALKDGVIGWVSMKSNQGVVFLKPTEKPFLHASKPATMHSNFDSSSKEVRKLQQDEVLELLEGPREETVRSEVTLRGSANKDSTSGWITLKDASGTTFASASKNLYVCRSTIAMTDNFDIRSCKVVRKVDVGEALEVIGGQAEKEDSNIEIKRLQFRAVRDGKDGWVTLKGNQGTVFLEPSTSHYRVEKQVALREDAARDSAIVRQLEPGETFEGKEAPREEKPDAKLGVLVRSTADSEKGWVLFFAGPDAPVRPHKG